VTACRRGGRPGVRAGVATLVAALVMGACSAGRDGADSSTATVATTLVTTTTTTVAPSTVTPGTVTPATVAPTTTELLPVLAERLTSVEVSVRIASPRRDRVVSIAATEAALAEVPDPGDPLQAAAWCSGVDGTTTGGSAGIFVVRITGEAIGEVDGGIEGFELVSSEPLPVSTDADTPADPVAARLHLQLDDGDLVAQSAVLMLVGEPSTGTFRAETADSTLIEGAFRCS
jgi:hypothetical protein